MQAVRMLSSQIHGMQAKGWPSLLALRMINRQRDSLELLRKFIDLSRRWRCTSCETDTSATRRKFELYNGSKIREEVEGRGGKSITLPDLADRVADDIHSRRISLSVAAKERPIGNRA